jgi:hypothetical protein
MQQLRGHHHFESTNTLRNSALHMSMPKGDRFKLEKKGSHFAQYKDPSLLSAAAQQTITSAKNLL